MQRKHTMRCLQLLGLIVEKVQKCANGRILTISMSPKLEANR